MMDHALKGSCDNWGRVWLMEALISTNSGFKGSFPPSKNLLPQGNHTITVEVENQNSKKKTTRRKYFTKDWIKPIVEGPPTPAELIVEYRGLNTGAKFTRIANSIMHLVRVIPGKFPRYYGDKQYKIQYEFEGDNNPEIIVKAVERDRFASLVVLVVKNTKIVKEKEKNLLSLKLCHLILRLIHICQ